MKLSQIITLALSLLTIILDISWMIKNKKFALVAIPEVLWLAHLVIFYISIALNLYDGFYSSWSSNLRLHGTITLLILILYRKTKRGMRNGGK